MIRPEIFALMREAGIFGVSLEEVGISKLQAFANAVIKAHEAKLITGAGEPAYKCTPYRNVRERWNVELDGDDLLVCFNDHAKGEACTYKRYVESPVQQKQSSLADCDASFRLRLLARDNRITTLESTLKAALEALEKSRGLEPVDIDWVKGQRKSAIKQIKEVLND